MQPKIVFVILHYLAIKETIDWYVNNQDWVEDILSGEYKNAYQKQR